MRCAGTRSQALQASSACYRFENNSVHTHRSPPTKAAEIHTTNDRQLQQRSHRLGGGARHEKPASPSN